ncbi:MAG TPA: BLUF domain-containing protein [Orrella sp.]
MLVRLLYVSRAADGQVTAELTESIMASARAYNLDNGITGVLCYGGDIFMQAIEGGRQEINALYSMILRDSRHCDVVLLHYEEIHERRFGGWTMGHVNLTKLNTSVVLKYSEKPKLDPYSMSGKVSMALLDELMLTASVIGRA